MTAEAWLHERLTSSGFVARYAHYAAVLAHLSVVDDPSVDVMAVSCARGRFYLHVRRDYFDRAPMMLPGVLLHEIHHIVLGHVTHAKFRGLARPDVLELAMEMSANEGIREPLPPHVAIADYAAFGIHAAQSTLERYELLLRASQRGERGARGRARMGLGEASSDGATVDDHGPWRDRLAAKERDDAGARAATRLAHVLADAVAEAAKAKRGAREDGGAHTDAARVAGRLPGVLLEELAERRTALVSWRTALRAFVARERRRSFDYRRPNRRFPDRIGEIPGRGRRQTEALPTLIVAIDTSGSMSTRELEEIAAELERLCELTKLVIVECDLVIQRSYPYEGRLRRVQGRGGTDLRPVFEPDVLARLDARGVVYFTDGEGPYPESPPKVPTLWVLTKDDGTFGCPWGARVQMRGEEASGA